MKPSILFLPGLLCDATLWRAQVTTLQEDYECIVADMTKDDTLTGMVTRALSQVPGRFSLVGLSMGGYAALVTMRMAPERVDRLALLDTSARADDQDRIIIRKALMERVREGDFANVVEDHISTFIHPSRLGDDALLETIRTSAHAVGPEAYIRQMTAIMTRPDNRDVLSGIDCPTLILCGSEDALTPPNLHDEMAVSISDSVLKKIDGSGHLPTLEKPDAVNAALRTWLET